MNYYEAIKKYRQDVLIYSVHLIYAKTQVRKALPSGQIDKKILVTQRKTSTLMLCNIKESCLQ